MAGCYLFNTLLGWGDRGIGTFAHGADLGSEGGGLGVGTVRQL